MATMVDQHSLHLQGAVNGRDVGGYPTADGHIVRTGQVFRSNFLSNLTPSDITVLEQRNVTVIDDLRTAHERELRPDRIPRGAVDRWRDVLGRGPAITLTNPPLAYPAFILEPGANEAVAAVLHDIITTKGALLYHCQTGKDRTGWITAVLLTILGVDRDTVNQDFLASNYTFHAAAGDVLRGVTLDELNSAFITIDAEYGNFSNYVNRGLGLTPDNIAELKAKMLR